MPIRVPWSKGLSEEEKRKRIRERELRAQETREHERFRFEQSVTEQDVRTMAELALAAIKRIVGSSRHGIRRTDIRDLTRLSHELCVAGPALVGRLPKLMHLATLLKTTGDAVAGRLPGHNLISAMAAASFELNELHVATDAARRTASHHTPLPRDETRTPVIQQQDAALPMMSHADAKAEVEQLLHVVQSLPARPDGEATPEDERRELSAKFRAANRDLIDAVAKTARRCYCRPHVINRLIEDELLRPATIAEAELELRHVRSDLNTQEQIKEALKRDPSAMKAKEIADSRWGTEKMLLRIPELFHEFRQEALREQLTAEIRRELVPLPRAKEKDTSPKKRGQVSTDRDHAAVKLAMAWDEEGRAWTQQDLAAAFNLDRNQLFGKNGKRPRCPLIFEYWSTRQREKDERKLNMAKSNRTAGSDDA